MLFTSLGLSEVLTHALDKLGYATPTPVQSQAIPVALRGQDLMARAQTGTGKTAAFGLPMIERLRLQAPRPRVGRKPRGLVVVPTRELALQVERALATYGAPVDIRVTTVIGGMPMRRQVDALQRGVDIVIATPGRLLDHMKQRTIDLTAVEIATIDEADRMLDMGFLPSLRRVCAALPRARQTLLFSATMSADVKTLAAAFTREAVHVDVSGGEAVTATVTHRMQTVAEDGKGAALTRVLNRAPGDQALVFCKTKRRSDRVGEHLSRAGIAAAVIHGNKSQGARTRALSDFKSRRVTVLVATDIAARGLDIPQLPLVVNYDLPMVAEDYVHRVGRTGRAGQPGRALSFVSARDHDLLRPIQRLVGATLQADDDRRAGAR